MKKPNGIITEQMCAHFLTIPGEKLIFAKRQHWFVLVAPITAALFLAAIFLLGSHLLFLLYYPSIPLYLSGNFLILLILLSVMVKLISDWHYNLYIVTTRKILKVSCSPLFSQTITEVLLDQVRVIEVNVKIKNFVHTLLDMGDVVIVFDRPSHEEMFVIANIEDPGATGDFLTHAFELIMHQAPVWFHPRDTSQLYKLTDDIYERHHTES